MSVPVKQGWLKKWSVSKNRWTDVYCKLLPSAWFQWFDNESSFSPKRSIDIRGVTAYLAFGQILNQVPCRPPSLTAAEIPQAFGVPHEPHTATKMSFFVCQNAGEMNAWMNAMMSVIQGGGYTQTQPPPAYQPAGNAPGAIGFGMPDPTSFGGNPVGMMPPYASGPAPGPYAPPPPTQPYGGYGQPPMTSGAYGQGMNPGAYQPGQPVGPAGYTGPPPSGQQFIAQNGQPYEVVYVQGKPKKKKMKGAMKSGATGLAGGLVGGLAGGLVGGLLTGKMFGGGWRSRKPCHFREWDCTMVRWDSWSSLSSLSWSD